LKKYIAVVGEGCPEGAKSALASLPEVEEVVSLPRDEQISGPIADHPDSVICVYKNRLFAHFEYARKAEKVLSRICNKCGLELCFTYEERSGEYPLDCSLNALCLEDKGELIGRKKSLAEPLKSLCTGNTNQGYAGCCALYTKSQVITADPSIEKACKGIGVPTYAISGRDISLPGYNEGFIGGASGAFEKYICIFGSPKYSESARELEAFCTFNDLTLVCLEDAPLTDRGGIKFIPTGEDN